MSITENLAHLHEQITEACRRSNRSESDVSLMAVSKVHPVEAILEAYAAGQRLFGENRVQEFQEKSPHLKDLTERHPHGRPYLYYTYGMACSEVEIDVLTGQCIDRGPRYIRELRNRDRQRVALPNGISSDILTTGVQWRTGPRWSVSKGCQRGVA